MELLVSQSMELPRVNFWNNAYYDGKPTIQDIGNFRHVSFLLVIFLAV